MADHLRVEVDNTSQARPLKVRMLGADNELFDLTLKEIEEEVTSSPMEPASKEYVDLKLEVALARIEAKLTHMPTTGAMIATAFTAAVGVIGIILAAMSYGGDRFDGGVGLADQRYEELQRNNERDARDAEQDAIIRRLDALLTQEAATPAPVTENPTE